MEIWKRSDGQTGVGCGCEGSRGVWVGGGGGGGGDSRVHGGGGGCCCRP